MKSITDIYCVDIIQFFIIDYIIFINYICVNTSFARFSLCMSGFTADLLYILTHFNFDIFYFVSRYAVFYVIFMYIRHKYTRLYYLQLCCPIS